MCDYSLMGVPSRLAKQGEELIVYRFQTGSKGLTSPAEITCVQSKTGSTFWELLKSAFRPLKVHSVPAVCIPPGARLILQDIPYDIQFSLAVGPVENVTFIQLDIVENRYRDAVRFANGAETLLQCLADGQRVFVVRLGSDTEEETDQHHAHAVRP